MAEKRKRSSKAQMDYVKRMKDKGYVIYTFGFITKEERGIIRKEVKKFGGKRKYLEFLLSMAED